MSVHRISPNPSLPGWYTREVYDRFDRWLYTHSSSIRLTASSAHPEVQMSDSSKGALMLAEHASTFKNR